MAKYRKRPVEVNAFQTDKEVDITTSRGILHADIDDFIINGKYPCKPDIFMNTYEHVNADIYRKKPVVIEAYQTDKEIDIQTLEGLEHAKAGDFIITGIKGEQYPCSPDTFKKIYELMEE